MRKKLWFLHLFLVFLFFGGLTGTIFSEELSIESPEKVGLSITRLDRIDSIIRHHIKSGELAGAVTLIARRGSIAYFKSFGKLDLESGSDMPRDAIFRIASMSKIFTSTAVMMLYEEGHFSLADPVSKYIPGFKNMKVAVWPNNDLSTKEPIKLEPANREITIRDLLRHTAGFTYSVYYPQLDELYYKAGLNVALPKPWPGTLQEFIKAISKLPLAFQPGSNWEYSYATDILGYLIEVTSGLPLDRFLKERIFEPLGLRDAGFILPGEKLTRFPNIYRFTDGKLKLVESAVTSEFRKPPRALSGGGGWTENGYGGLICTAMDYAKILQMLLNGGKLNEKRLLSRKTVELMFCNHLVDIPRGWLPPGVGFGLTSAVLEKVEKFGELGTPGQMWWAGSCNTYFFLDPKEEMFGILMTQMYPFGYLDLMERFRVLSLQAIDD
jgi:CubicO group peptidase (beta-lactamase class C family)